MKIIIKIFLSIVLFAGYSCITMKSTPSQNQNDTSKTYLALGDSYTIGEGVEEKDRYPNQTVEMLKSSGMTFSEPLIIAKTGWTTDELVKAIADAKIGGKTYDLVTLLIGVNNQYRGRPVENFKAEFADLLEKAIAFADGNPRHVVVLSIPDWGMTPFASAKEVDKEKVAGEIDQYNAAKKQITGEKEVHYIDITEEYRATGSLPEMLVADKLHPSGMVYQKWAKKIHGVVVESMEFQ